MLIYHRNMDIDTIGEMYKSGASAQEIADHFGKTIWQVYRLMKQNSFPRRRPSETTGIKFRNSPLSFSFKSNLSQSEKLLWLSGLMLYWAEGSKAGRHVVDFANSNSDMVSIFLKMLRVVYRINEDKLRVYIYCYSNQDVDSIINFWSDLIKISKSKFTKPYIRKDFDPNKIDKMPHGLVHIRYSDMRLLEKIKEDIAKIAFDILGQDGGAVNHTTL